MFLKKAFTSNLECFRHIALYSVASALFSLINGIYFLTSCVKFFIFVFTLKLEKRSKDSVWISQQFLFIREAVTPSHVCPKIVLISYFLRDILLYVYFMSLSSICNPVFVFCCYYQKSYHHQSSSLGGKQSWNYFSVSKRTANTGNSSWNTCLVEVIVHGHGDAFCWTTFSLLL